MVSDLLTPDQMRKELADANDAASREVNPNLQRAYLGIARIFRDYLTLWERNKELEKTRLGLEVYCDELLQEIDRD